MVVEEDSKAWESPMSSELDTAGGDYMTHESDPVEHSFVPNNSKVCIDSELVDFAEFDHVKVVDNLLALVGAEVVDNEL